MSDDVLDQVRQTVADVFNLDITRVNAATSPQTVEAWDSINHLNLVLALEQQCGVSFSPEEIPELTSVENIAQCVGRKLG